MHPQNRQSYNFPTFAAGPPRGLDNPTLPGNSSRQFFIQQVFIPFLNATASTEAVT